MSGNGPIIRASDGLVVNQAPAGLGHTATIPDAAIARLTKFAVEWAVLMGTGRYGDLVYGLHSGDAREANLRHSDICALLKYAEATSTAKEGGSKP